MLLAFAFVEAVLLYAIWRCVKRLPQSEKSDSTAYLESHTREGDMEGQS